MDSVDFGNLTGDSSETKAINGMRETLSQYGPRLTIAGWCQRDGNRVQEFLCRFLERLSTVVG